MDAIVEKKRPNLLFQKRSRLKFIMHSQPQPELVYVRRGRTRLRIDGELYTAAKGDVVAIFPYQIHEYLWDSEDFDGVLLIFSPEMIGGQASDYFSRLPDSPIIGKMEDSQLINALYAAYNTYENETEFRNMILFGYLSAVVGSLLENLKFTSAAEPLDDICHRVLRYCAMHYTEPLTLETLERELFVSRSYLSHVFGDKLGTGFCQYVNSLRISETCRILRAEDEQSMTEIARRVGFGSIRSFNRAFLLQTGLSPMEYRKSHRA